MDRISRHGARVILTAIATSLVFFGSFTTIPAASAATGDPTIASDQPDYAAGSVVTLSGTAWDGDSSVHINVDDSLGKTWSRDVDVPVAADGTITDSFTLPSNFVASYAVTATGNDTQRQATATFTDAAINVSNTQGETATAGVPSGSYTNGAITSYREGDFINFRFTLTNSDSAARSGNLTLEYDDVGSGCTAAGFFLSPFNLGTHQGGPAVVGITGSVPTVTKVGVPTINASNWNQAIHITFGNAGSATVNFNLQLSNEAGACSGASTHVGFASGSQTGDVGSPGTQSWPVPAKDVISLGDVTVIKKIDRNGDGTFESTASAGEYQFCMTNYPTTGTTTCQNTDGSGQTVFTNVIDGAHAITESQLNTSQGTYSFVSGSGTGVNGGTCTFSGSTATATVFGDTASPDSATCTFNNGVVKGSIELKKVWSGTGGQTTLQIGTTDGGFDKATQQTGLNGGTPLTTGKINVTPGTYYLSETGGLGQYTASAFTCFNDNGAGGGTANNGTKDGGEQNVTVTATAQGGSVSVASNAVVVCSITNTRNTGTIEVIKDFVGAAGKVNLQVDGTNKVTDVGDNGTTGAVTVDTGNHSVGETAGTGTNLSDYTSAIVCKKGTTTVASGTGTSLSGISVGSGDAIVCTITNTRTSGTIEVIKDFVGTAGKVNLQVDGTTKAADVGDNGTTGAVGVDTGNHSVGETAGTATSLSDYTSSIVCKKGTTTVASGNGTSLTGVSVGSGDAIVCTITNTRTSGTIEVIKDFVGTAGKVNLQVDGTTKAADVGDNGTTGAVGVDTGNHSVGETAGTATSLSDYTSSIVCKKGTTTVASGNGTSLTGVSVGSGDAIVCTITNTRKSGTLEVIKDFQGTAGKVNLQVDTVDKATDVGDGGTTGVVTVDTGNHSVGETAGTGTSLSDYTSSIICKDIANNTVAGGNGTSLSGISIGSGDAITCTITNVRKQGTIKVIKDFVGTAGKVNLQVDGTTKATDVGDGGNTGFVTVDTGNHSVGETAGTGTSLSDYNSSIECLDAQANVVATGTGTSLPTVPVGEGDAITCTVSNTRKAGTIEVIKTFQGTAGKVNLQVDGTTKFADAGDGDTTGAVPVDTGKHSVGETAGTGTSLTDYTSSISCVDATDTVVASGSGTSLANIQVNESDAIVCTITNTRKSGTLEVIKDFQGTAGKVNLQIDTVDKATDVGDGGTTTPVTVDTGKHSVGETAGTGTNLNDYNSSIQCLDAQANVVASGSGTSLGNIQVNNGDAITCTITNVRKQGTIKVIKDFVGTAGKVNLQVDGTTKATDVGDGGNTGFVTVDTGNHSVGETAGTGTSLSDYNSSIECLDAQANVVATGTGTSLPTVPVGEGDAITCTVSNTRKAGTIEVIKTFQGTAGKVNLQVDGTTKFADAGDGDTTGAVPVDTGKHSVGETAGTGTSLTDYTSSISCVDATDTVVASGSGTSLANIQVNESDAIVCTITNTRKSGTLEVIKDFQGTAGKVNLQIDTVDKATDVGDGGTTTPVTVDTGKHSVGETAGTGTNLNDYNSSIQCLDAQANVVASGSGTSLGNIQVNNGDAITCTITNVRKQGTIKVIKDFVGTAGKVNLQVDGTTKATDVGDGGNTGFVTVDTGNHSVGETAGTGTSLSDYNSSIECLDAQANVVATGTGTSLPTVPVGEGDAITCTVSNTRKAGTIEVIKTFQGTAGKVNLQVDGTTKFADAGDGDTTGAVPVDTGKHSVGETAGTGTSLTDYTSSISCVDATDTVVASGSGTSLANIQVNESDAIVCTITNTRKSGTLEVIKDFQGTAGKVNLQIDTVDKATDVGDGGTTTPVTVDTGKHSVGETAGTGTNLNDYNSSIQCLDAQANVVASGSGTSLGNIQVNNGDAITCTITNVRKQGTIKVIKDFVGTAGKVNLQVDGTTKATDVGDGGNTGFVTVDTGNHSVGETAGTGTSLSDYNSSIECLDAQANVVATGTGTSLPTVPVGEGDAITCTVSNTRKAGTIEVIKTFQGTAGKVNLQVDGTTKFADAGDGDTTGAVPVDTGKHSVGETAGTGTSLTDYTSSISCVDATDTVVASGSGTSLANIQVNESDAIVCTITNTRKSGTLEVIKDFQGTAGKVNLQIDTVDKATDVGDGGTTTPVTVDTGKHSVGETAGTGTNLNDYNSSIQCLDAQANVVASGSGTSLGNIQVNNGDAITCTITNVRKQGTIKVIKDFVGTAGKVNLQVDGTTKATDVGDGGNTGFVTVDTGNHSVGETAGTGTSLSDYNSSIECLDAQANVVATGTGTSLPTVPVGEGDAITCTVSNTRKAGTIEVIKTFQGTAGKVNLQVDGTTKFADAGDGDTTGAVPVDTGKHSVGETAGTGTSLTDYTSSISCVDATDTVVASGSGTSLANIQVNESDAIVCTITNTRKSGTLEVIKDFQGTAGKVNLQIDTVDKATDVGDGGTTTPVTVDTGKHSVGETAGTGTNLNDYNSSIQCLDAQANVVASGSGTSLGNIQVNNGDAITCTITNVRKQGTIKVIKDFVGTAGKVNLQVDGTTKATDVGDGGNTGFVTVDTGNHSVGETAGTGTSLSDYNSSVSCVNGFNTVVAFGSGTSLTGIPVAENAAIVCTITNTRKQGTIKVVKDFVGTAGKVNLQVDGTTKATDVGDNGTTGFVAVDTGNHSVGETAGTGTSLSDYDSSVSCVNGSNTVVASGTGTSLSSIPVGENAAIVCTITNTRKQGTIKVIKDFVGTAGKVNLQVDGTTKATDVGDNGTTGFVTVDTGNHSVGETAGTGTSLSVYNSSVSCVNGSNTVVASGTGTSLSSIPVGENAAIVCTITNTRKSGTLNVYKYHDLNANGSKGATEPYLGGWTFFLDLNGNGTKDANEPSAITGDGTGGTTLGLATFSSVDTGTYSVCEVLQANWFNSQPGPASNTKPCQSVTITENTTSSKTFGNFQKVKIKVAKTVNGGPLSATDSFTFTLRQGATTANASDGTILDTQTITQGNNPATFAPSLLPGTYQVCETVPPKFGSSLIEQDWNGDGSVTYGDPSQNGDWFVPGLSASGGSSDNANTIVCANITVKSGDGTVTIAVDNHPPSMARTIGYWKNWSSCGGSKGKQQAILDQTLAAAVSAGHPITLGSYQVTTCAVAVDILDKRYVGNLTKVGDGAKAASNPAMNVAAQLLAYKLNIQLGANANCSAAVAAAKNVDAYLTSLGYNGNLPTKVTNAQIAANLNYANGILDAYNNATLSCSMVLHPPYPGIWI